MNYLMDAPDFPKQPHCPICGRTDLPMEGHHVIHRSQGGHDGPVIYICKACHARHHDVRDLEFVYDSDFSAWAWSDKSIDWCDRPLVAFRVYDEQRDEVPFDALDADEELMEVGSTLELHQKADYLLGSAVSDLVDKVGEETAVDLLLEHFDFQSKRTAKTFITKRARHGRLTAPGVEYLGVNAANLIASLVEQGYDEAEVVDKYRTYPRAQFNECYGIESRARKRACPRCGVEL